MAAIKPAAGKPGLEEGGSQIHRIRITLTSRNVKNLEKGAFCFGFWFKSCFKSCFQVLLAIALKLVDATWTLNVFAVCRSLR